MKVSLFKLGIMLMVIGVIWITFIFIETEKTYDEVLLKESTSFELKIELQNADIGFYKIYMPEFTGEEVFTQILDTKDNVIEEQLIQTKMSVGYFDFNDDGTHTMKVTNISKNSVNLQVEIGNTNSQEMIPAGILIVVGAITIMTMSYLKLKNYNIAQPDENIS